jgi:hypothetical protein
MSGLERLLEDTEDGPVIHANAPHEGDKTLCGYVEEGVCDGSDESGWRAVSRGKINCHQCLAIIHHAKAIPARLLGRPAS